MIKVRDLPKSIVSKYNKFVKDLDEAYKAHPLKPNPTVDELLEHAMIGYNILLKDNTITEKQHELVKETIKHHLIHPIMPDDEDYSNPFEAYEKRINSDNNRTRRT